MNFKIHIVPHTHWDREWYRTFQQFRIRLVRLMDRLLDILDKDDGYTHFMLDGQTRLLEDYLEVRPERKEGIARLVREGRLSIGPWYVLADEFLVAPESLVRNLLLGEKISRQFGGGMSIGYVPDLFGHIAQLPQLLQGFAMNTAVLRRGLADEPAELCWQAPDGSRVLICYLRNGYDNATRLPMTNPEAFVKAITTASDRLKPYAKSGQILLMAGNDHQEPDPRLPGLIAHANNRESANHNLHHNSLSAFVAAVQDSVKDQVLPTVKGELRASERHHLLPGVLSTRMWLKQRNDAIETTLLRWTEPFAAWAELLCDKADSESPTLQTGHAPLLFIRNNAAIIEQAWRILLDNHPHDSICGCSIDQVHNEMAFRFDQSEQIAEEIASLSLMTIAQQIDTRLCTSEGLDKQDIQPLIVFNPTEGFRTDVVMVRLCLPESPEGYEVLDTQGNLLPHAIETEPLSEEERLFFDRELGPDELGPYLSMVRGGKLLGYIIHQIQVNAREAEAEVLLSIGKQGTPNRAQVAVAQAKIEALLATGKVSRFIIRTLMTELSDLIFLASDLPAYGYATFIIRPAQGASLARNKTHLLDAYTIENDLLLVEVNPSDGSFTLTDKRTGEVFPGLNRFVDGGDRGDSYNYCQPEQDELIDRPAVRPRVQLVKQNSVLQMLEIQQIYHLPVSLSQERARRSSETRAVSIVSRISLYTGVARVDIETIVDNQVEDHRLRVHFPVPVNKGQAFTESHFHVAQRLVPQIPENLDTSDWIEQPVATVPQRGWADVNDGHLGLMIANRGLPELEFIPEDETTVIALTLLRCVGWLSRDDIHCRKGRAGSLLPTPEAQCPGRQSFHYSIISHTGSWERARVQAEAFRVPLRALAAELQHGPLPRHASLVEVSSSSFSITAIKQPQNASQQGLIIRGVNLSDKKTMVQLRPWQIFSRAIRTHLNEIEQEALPMAEGGSITISVNPWEIVTVQWY
ncbi:MAG: hypothetical protein KC422_21990 [Trueperaceae bacterium]|nr:hypothetical protein [Trueperaceae bacterium]